MWNDYRKIPQLARANLKYKSKKDQSKLLKKIKQGKCEEVLKTGCCEEQEEAEDENL